MDNSLEKSTKILFIVSIAMFCITELFMFFI